jgi:hypothetical protein
VAIDWARSIDDPEERAGQVETFQQSHGDDEY